MSSMHSLDDGKSTKERVLRVKVGQTSFSHSLAHPAPLTDRPTHRHSPQDSTSFLSTVNRAERQSEYSIASKSQQNSMMPSLLKIGSKSTSTNFLHSLKTIAQLCKNYTTHSKETSRISTERELINTIEPTADFYTGLHLSPQFANSRKMLPIHVERLLKKQARKCAKNDELTKSKGGEKYSKKNDEPKVTGVAATKTTTAATTTSTSPSKVENASQPDYYLEYELLPNSRSIFDQPQPSIPSKSSNYGQQSYPVVEQSKFVFSMGDLYTPAFEDCSIMKPKEDSLRTGYLSKGFGVNTINRVPKDSQSTLVRSIC